MPTISMPDEDSATRHFSGNNKKRREMRSVNHSSNPNLTDSGNVRLTL